MRYKLFILTFGILLKSLITYSQQYQEMEADEVKQIIRIAIDLPKLQQYFHVDTDSTRKPLIIKEYGLINAENLNGIEKFGAQIMVLTEKEIIEKGIKSYLNINDWTYVNNKLRLQMDYQIEGLLINYIFDRKDNNWELTESELLEE